MKINQFYSNVKSLLGGLYSLNVLAVYNLKGGVGKTSTAVNMAYLAAKMGYKTLLWDLDPQGASSWYFQCSHDKKITFKRLFPKRGVLPCKYILKTNYLNLDIIPADLSYREFDPKMKKGTNTKALEKTLSAYKDNYNLVILDCPPGISYMTDNIMHAMDAILMPMIPTWLSLHSYKQLQDFLKQNNLPDSNIYPFFSMVDNRKKLHHEWLTVPPMILKKLLKTYIPYASAIEKMGEFHAPVEEFSANSAGAASYRVLWDEVYKKILRKKFGFPKQ